jgi:hypothetical protein
MPVIKFQPKPKPKPQDQSKPSNDVYNFVIYSFLFLFLVIIVIIVKIAENFEIIMATLIAGGILYALIAIFIGIIKWIMENLITIIFMILLIILVLASGAALLNSLS